MYSLSLSSSDYEAVVKLSEDFNGADLRNVCTEAGETQNFILSLYCSYCISLLIMYNYVHALYSGMFAIREDRDYVINEDFMKAVRKVSDTKKLETKLDYKQV